MVIEFKYANHSFFLPFSQFILSIRILQAKPSLADQNVILVFVIGGINGLEVKFLNTFLSSLPLTIPLMSVNNNMGMVFPIKV